MINSVALPNVELINIEPSKISPLISKCGIKVCYVSDEPNRNRSVITKDVARELAYSLRGAPIVGNYSDFTEDFEEHNRVISIKGGKIEVREDTRPYGFVDLNAKCWFQEFDDEGVVHEYLMTEGWIWTGQYPEAQRVIDEGNNQSMELDENFIDAFWTKDNNGKPQFFIINEAIISKLCILGEDYEPCFEGAQIGADLQFSFDEGYKTKLFSLIEEMTQILKEGGTPVFTTYAVEIGDALWSALWDYLAVTYPDEEGFCSMYRIEGIYEEGSQKFAILQHRSTMDYFRLNFTLTEEGFAASAELTAVEKEFVPAQAQFSLEDIEKFETEYAAAKKKDEEKEEEEICEECGKPVSECECDNEEDKKDKYVLEEIPEYVELSEKFSALGEENETLKNSIADLEAAKATLETQLGELTEFKKSIERKEKEAMINDTFYMLSPELKQDVVDNIDTYSLDDIEAKLSTICFRNKISFTEGTPAEPNGSTTYNLGEVPSDDEIPAWVKAVMDTQKNM